MTYRSKAAAVAATCLSASLAACGGSGGTGQTVDHFEDATYNSQQLGIQTFCGANNNTAFGQLTLHFTDGSSTQRTVYWNAPKQNQNTYININTNGLGTNWRATNSAAINVWQTTLESAPALPAGRYYSLLPQESTGTAPVVATEAFQDASNPSTVASFGLALDGPGNYITGSGYTFYNAQLPATADGRYSAALHELGHVMGLAHNPDLGSIMFPFNDGGTNGQLCYFYNGGNGTHPRYPTDTAALESRYDPVMRDDSYDPNPHCGARNCLSLNLRIVPVSGVADPRTAAIGTTIKSDPRALRGRVESSEFQPGALRAPASVSTLAQPAVRWIHGNEYPMSLEISTEGLVLSSSLVSQGLVGRTVAQFASGSETYVVKEFTVRQLFRHLLGPDQNVKSGDKILIVDNARTDGGVYIDDPILESGTAPIVFLKRASPKISAMLHQPVLYSFTTHFVSKWVADKSLKIHVLSARNSRVAMEVNGHTAGTLFKKAYAKYGASTLREDALLRSMLSAHGVTGDRAVQGYVERLRVAPESVRVPLGTKDLAPVRRTEDFALVVR
jgi:hypothetical protein